MPHKNQEARLMPKKSKTLTGPERAENPNPKSGPAYWLFKTKV
jgi:hypothetical protein